MSVNCDRCGFSNSPGIARCQKCGAGLPAAQPAPTPPVVPVAPVAPVHIQQPVVQAASKSKLAAGLLALFLGGFGVHNFYLGHNGKGAVQLILGLSMVGWVISGIWAFIEMIMIFTGSLNDAEGQPLA